MKISRHVLIGLAFGGLLYKLTGNFFGILWFLISSIFIDLDHYFDYIKERGIILNFKKFHNAFWYEYMSFKKMTLFLHSYELLIILWLIIFFFNLGIIWKCIAMGYTLHMLLDQLANPIFPLSYFLWFRALNGFTTNKIVYDRNLKNKREGGVCLPEQEIDSLTE